MATPSQMRAAPAPDADAVSKVLCVDDSAVYRQLAEMILGKSGIRVAAVGSAVDAWSMIAKNDHPRLLLVDWMMPQMDGLELCRRIRQRHDKFYTYVIVMSARTLKVDLLTALQAGIDDYLTKPFNNEELISKVHIGLRMLEREDKLSNLCDEWQTIVDALPSGVADLGPDGALRRANRALLTLYGGDPQRFLGRSLGASVLRSSQEYVEVAKAVRTNTPFSGMEVEFTRSNGVVRHLKLTGRPLPPVNGLTYQVTTSDISTEAVDI